MVLIDLQDLRAAASAADGLLSASERARPSSAGTYRGSAASAASYDDRASASLNFSRNRSAQRVWMTGSSGERFAAVWK